MKSEEQLVYLNALGQIKGLGPVKVKSLLSRFPDLRKIFYLDANTLMSVRGISQELAWQIKHKAEHLQESEVFVSQQLEIAHKLGAKLIPITDEDYPKLLKQTSHSPESIYVLGNFETLKRLHTNSISIAGTRKSTEYGNKRAYQFGREFAEVDWLVVSGLARGIDAAAHSGCLDGSGYTIAVVGSGVDVIYPKETLLERNRILEHGLIVSEYTFGTRPLAVNLKKRNKIIVGLSEGLIIVQTGIKGGAYNAVQAAKEQKKLTFAVKPNSDQSQFDGNIELIESRKAIPISPETGVTRKIIERIRIERATLL
jgi:DNA processing protein